MRLTESTARKAINKWRAILGVNQLYKVHFEINNQPDHTLKPSQRKDVEAKVKVDEAYYNIYLVLNAYEFEAEDLDHVIAHELLHVVLARMTTLTFETYGDNHEKTASNLIESTTEQLAQAFMRALATRPKKGRRKA